MTNGNHDSSHRVWRGKAPADLHLGLNYAINVADDFFVTPALNFVQNGAKWSYEGEMEKENMNYVQIPATFQYKPTLGLGRLVLGVGPYVGLGIGKIKYSGGEESESYTWKEAEYKQTDLGAKLQVGYELSNGLYFLLNADRGLTTLDKNSEYKAYNSAFGISVGFRL